MRYEVTFTSTWEVEANDEEDAVSRAVDGLYDMLESEVNPEVVVFPMSEDGKYTQLSLL